LLKSVDLGEDAVTALHFADGGKRLYAVGRKENPSRLWDIDPASGKVLRERPLSPKWTGCTFSQDGAFVAVSTGFRHWTKIVDLATDKIVISDGSDADPMPAVAFHPDGRTAALGTWFGRVRLLDLRTGKVTHEYHVGHKATALAYTRDGKDLIAVTSNPHATGFTVGSGDGILRFNAEDGKSRWHFQIGHLDRVGEEADAKSIRFSGISEGLTKDSKWLWRWLDAETGKLLDHTVEAESGLDAVRPDGRAVAIGGKSISQFDPVTRSRLNDASHDPPEPAFDLRFSPDGSRVLGWARAWYEWEVGNGKQTRLSQPLSPKYASSLTASRDRKWLARRVDRGGGSQAIEVVDLESGKVRDLYSGYEHQHLRFLADGRLFGSSSGGMAVFDPVEGKETLRLPCDQETGEHFVPSPLGDTVLKVSGERDRVDVVRFDLRTGKRTGGWSGHPVGPFPKPERAWPRGELSPDGRLLLVSYHFDDFSRHVAVFEAATGRLLSGWNDKLQWAPDYFYSGYLPGRHFAFAIDGRAIACFSAREHGVDIREVATGGLRRHLVNRPSVTSCAFGPSGRLLAVATSPGPVDLWDLGGKPAAWEADRADETWRALADEKSDVAYDAMARLLDNPNEGTALLRSRLTSTVAPAADVVARHIADLDSPEFRKRELAAKELAAAGELVVTQLRAAAEKAPPESRQQLGGLIARVDAMNPDRLRAIRACEVLEGIGNAGATAVLSEWAKGPPAATLTREASSSLNRLNKRK
jgi:WD40 repeat protein